MRRTVIFLGCASLLLVSVAWAETASAKRKPAAEMAPVPVENIAELLAAIKSTHASIVLLNVWAPGCSHCLREMPALVRLNDAIFKKNDNFAILGLSLIGPEMKKKEALEKAQGIIRRKGLSYQNLVWLASGDPLKDKFGIDSTPFNLLLTADGKVIDVLDISTDPARAVEAVNKSLQKAAQALAFPKK